MPSNFKALAGAAAGSEASDANFKNVTLLLHGDGSNGAQNNTFIDSSTNNFTITRNGNTTQGSFSPYGSNWSNYFDGSGDYLRAPNNTALNVWDNGSGSFTVEAWLFATASISNNVSIIGKATLDGNIPFNGWALQVYNGYLNVNTQSNDRLFSNTTAVPLNQWVHVALVKSGSTVSLYQNGTRVGTITNSSTYSNTVDEVHIGIDRNPAGPTFTGYISNIRMVKGTAVYDPSQSTITVPTAPLTAITNTSLLTCAYNRFRDGSTNNFTITRNGDVKVTNFAPFAPSSAYSTTTNGGSAYFDGTGDYLTVANNGNFDFGSGDFTVECWVYVNDSADNDGIVGIWGTGKQSWILYREGANWQFFYSGPSGSPLVSSVGVTVGTWVHLAVVRSGSTLTFYHNGVSTGTKNVGTTAFTSNSTQNLGIGVNLDGTGNILNGYMSDLRIVKGTAVYTSGFTPPTSPLSAVTNTNLLMKPTNAAIFDNSMKNDLETVGNAQISTSVKKFGTGSMYFDGNGDYLTPASRDAGVFGTGDFTVECWVYATGAPQSNQVIWNCNQYPNTTGLYLAYYGSGSTQISVAGGGSSYINASGGWSLNEWHHVAVVRSGSTMTLYIDGTSRGSTTFTNNCSDGLVFIGRPYDVANYMMQGYIDELRITKGVARYTSNFTAPTAPFPNK